MSLLFKCVTLVFLMASFFFTWEHSAWAAVGFFLGAVLSSNEIE
jgi:hypothetical protein